MSGRTSCRHDPTQFKGAAIGMYHCPDCGIMVLADYPHPDDEACRFQLAEWEPPDYGEEPDLWVCESCGERFSLPTFSHSRAEHAPGCDGTCKVGCPVEVQCGPVSRREP